MIIRQFKKIDFSSVQNIYQQGIDTGNATFQEKVKSWEEWNGSMLTCCRFVAVDNDEIVGWTGISPVSSREVYSGVAEVSVYVANVHQGKGVGNKLLSHLVVESEKHNIWTLQAGIFPENKASIFLHERNGFKKLATREKLGKMQGVWRDIVFMERRSKVVGI